MMFGFLPANLVTTLCVVTQWADGSASMEDRFSTCHFGTCDRAAERPSSAFPRGAWEENISGFGL